MTTDPVATAHEIFSEPAFYFRQDYFISIRCALVRSMLESTAGASILDLGCGDGRVSLQFCGEAADVTLVDFSEAMLARARARIPAACGSTVDVVQADIAGFTSDRRFDVVLCLGVMPHLPSPREALSRIASLLEPGGVAIVQITDGGTMLGRLALLAERMNTRVSGLRRHRLKPTSVRQMAAWGREVGLTMDLVRRHGVIVPGAGRLPNEALLRWEHFVIAHPALARAGADAVIRFRKEPG